MTTGATGQLGLALPVQGELSGTWGDTVNNGITQYTNIAIAATLTLTNNGAVTLANTTGNASASNITSSLTGAGTVTAQFAIVRITGTLTTTKVVTGPSYSKTYVVVNAATGGTVTFKASGQTGVSIAVGESAYVYYNGTDYVKLSTTVASGVTTFSAGTTGFTPSTATSGAVTLAGTLAVANGGTGLTSGTSGGILAYTASGTLASSSALIANKVVIGGGAGVAPSTTNLLGTAAAVTSGNYIQAIGYADTVTALGNTGTAINLDITSGGVFTATLTGNATITLRYPVATGASSFTLILTNDGTAGRTVAFSGGTFKYPGGSVTRTTTANAVDIWFFFTPDGGTTYYASIPMANLS